MADSAAEQAEEASLPIGYRFSPTEVELVVYYLKNMSSLHPFSSSVYNVDVYQFSPWDLQRFYPAIRVKKSYFITELTRKYGKGSRPDRKTRTGRWKTSGKDKKIFDESGNFVGGICRTLVYFMFTNNGREEKTAWRMKEYRIDDLNGKTVKRKSTGPEKLDGQFLCTIYETNKKVKNNEYQIDADEGEQEEDTMPQLPSEIAGGSYCSNLLNVADVVDPSYGFGFSNQENMYSFIDQKNLFSSDQPNFSNLMQLPSNDLYFGEMELPQTNSVQPSQLWSSSSNFACDSYVQTGNNEEGSLKTIMSEKSIAEHEENTFPIGIRFEPTDEEIILYYLMKQPSIYPLARVVHVVDFYEDEPWILQERYPMTRVNHTYFITQRNKICEGGIRAARKAGIGTWKASGNEITILDQCGHPIGGTRRTLVYYLPGDKKTNWIMQEYRIGQAGEGNPTEKKSGTMRLQGEVLCKLYLNQRKHKLTKADDNNDEHGLDLASENTTNSSASLMLDPSCHGISALHEASLFNAGIFSQPHMSNQFFHLPKIANGVDQNVMMNALQRDQDFQK